MKIINSIANEHIAKDVVGNRQLLLTNNYGDFGGSYDFQGYKLISSTDGVGTKSILSHQVHGDYGFELLGQDLVSHRE